MWNDFWYLGKDKSSGEFESLPENTVIRFLNPNANNGSNIIAYNYFSSLSLATKLKKKNKIILG